MESPTEIAPQPKQPNKAARLVRSIARRLQRPQGSRVLSDQDKIAKIEEELRLINDTHQYEKLDVNGGSPKQNDLVPEINEIQGDSSAPGNSQDEDRERRSDTNEEVIEKKFVYPSLQEAIRAVYGRDLPEGELEGAKFTDAKGHELQVSSSSLQDFPVRFVSFQDSSSPLSSYAIDPEDSPRLVDRFSTLRDNVFVEDTTTGVTLPLSHILPENTLLYFFPQRELIKHFPQLEKHFTLFPRRSVSKEIEAGRWKKELEGMQIVLLSDIEDVTDLAKLFHEVNHQVDIDARGSDVIDTLWDLSPYEVGQLLRQGISPTDINNEQVTKERNAWALTVRLARRLVQHGFSAIPSFPEKVAEIAQSSLGTYEKDRLPPSIDDVLEMDTFTNASRLERKKERAKQQELA